LLAESPPPHRDDEGNGQNAHDGFQKPGVVMRDFAEQFDHGIGSEFTVTRFYSAAPDKRKPQDHTIGGENISTLFVPTP
jgi:hypothetical protein